MDAKTCLLTRRSVRKYRSDPIPDADLLEILEAGCYAPSAINLQHWYFAALRSPEDMAALKEIMVRVVTAFNPTLRERFAKHPETIAQTQNFLTTLGGAPVCVLAFFRKNDYPDRDGAMQSVAAAIENILLAAWDKGIGSCWISAPLKVGMGEELRQRFAPDKGEFVAAITLGYPDETPRCPVRRGGQFDLR
ncbi:MAG TPA: nitroreductase family protein [Candidatus Galloscillospira excrementavium]|nr:nitroreductase family protein [Candidatus Galloscillospira excrementavium]